MYRLDDHTADVRIRLEARTLPDLLREAGRAVAELLAGDLPLGLPRDPVRIHLTARSVERLLVDWIDELVFRSETERLVFTAFDPLVATPGQVDAVAHGRGLEDVRTAIKAATLHGLEVAHTDDRWTAAVVLDV